MHDVEVVVVETIWTAVIKDTVPASELYKFVPAACGEVWTFVKSAGIPKPGRHVALYLDTPGAVEVGVEVSAPFTGNDRVQCSQVPGGRAAHAVHYGPYGGLGNTHAAIQSWCNAQGHRCTGVSWELYGHWEPAWNSDPSKIRTDVYYLLGEK